jgi:hypothetical protein
VSELIFKSNDNTKSESCCWELIKGCVSASVDKIQDLMKVYVSTSVDQIVDRIQDRIDLGGSCICSMVL